MKTLGGFLFLLPHISATMLLLWAIAIVGSYFYVKGLSDQKTDSFECGFENTSLGDAQLRFKNATVLAFLLVYDLELLLLLPISFNIGAGIVSKLPILLILGTILYTCIWDIETGTLEYEN